MLLVNRAQPFAYWLSKNYYYHKLLIQFYQFIIPVNSRILHIGCKNGYLLNALKPAYGSGIEWDSNYYSEAQERYQNYTFFSSLEELTRELPEITFDYIIFSSSVMEIDDIQNFFELTKKFTHNRTRLVIDWYATLWEPVLLLTQKLGLRRQTPLKNWLSPADLKNFLYLAGYEIVTEGKQILLPVNIPGISWFFNKIIAVIPGISYLCLNNWIIARPHQEEIAEKSVSIIIPCKNERGNIEAAITRTPRFGASQEFIFIDGHSRDNSFEEMVRVKELYPETTITVLQQTGKGKGDAVRLGFDTARGDVLMILDGDLTMPPEELPKFYYALISGKGELINGSRLIYGMESEAMRFLNLLANYCFGVGFTWVLNQRIKDTLCGTKVLYKTDYQKIVNNRDFFGDFDPFGDFDLLFGAAKQNLKILDVPIHYKNRTYGTSQIHRFSAGILLLRMSFLAFRKFKMRW